MSQSDITVLIPCFNNSAFLATFIPTCGWAREVLVVDSYSTDGSPDVARHLGARVLQRQYENSARQKNWALEHVATEWVFQIDTDEVMDERLTVEIVKAVNAADSGVAAFRLARKNHYGNYWMHYGGLYPDYQVRLIRAQRCRWQDREVHASVNAEGSVGTLTTPIIHYGMRTISDQLDNLNRYTNYERDEKLKRGATTHPLQLMYLPPFVFLHRWLWKQGFRDGWRGLVLAGYSAVYIFTTIVKLLEVKREKNNGEG